MTYRIAALLVGFAAGLAAQIGGPNAASSGTTPKDGSAAYPVHAQAGNLGIGAEYTVHSFSGGRQNFIAKDYLVVEVALFPAKGIPVLVDTGHFTLRVNHKKDQRMAQAPQMVAGSLKYPSAGPTGVAAIGPIVLGPRQAERFPGDPNARTTPRPPVPDANNSGMDQEPLPTAEDIAVWAALPEGESRRPVSGYLYFAYDGKVNKIRSLELSYEGPEGTATLPLI